MTKKLGRGDDGSRLVDAAGFTPWAGDPFAGQPRQHGQIDYECNACGRGGRHPYHPDVPPGWWYLWDQAADTVKIVCKPQCAVELSGISLPKDASVRQLIKALVAAGWRYRSPEQKRDDEPAAVGGLSGGWNSGTV